MFRDVGSLEPGVEWHVAIERVLGSSDACIVVIPSELPAVDFSGATMAERATFIQLLASEPCTCGCGLDMHNCLLKDRTCPLSPGLARTQWAAFLQLVRA